MPQKITQKNNKLCLGVLDLWCAAFDLKIQFFAFDTVICFCDYRRNKKGVIAQVIVPAGFIALALVFTLIIPQVRNYPPLELQPWMYGDTNTFYR